MSRLKYLKSFSLYKRVEESSHSSLCPTATWWTFRYNDVPSTRPSVDGRIRFWRQVTQLQRRRWSRSDTTSSRLRRFTVVLGKAKYSGRPSSTVIGPRREHGLAASLRKLTDRVSGATVQSRKPPLAPGTSQPLPNVTCARIDPSMYRWQLRTLF